MNTPLGKISVSIDRDTFAKLTGTIPDGPRNLVLEWSLLFEYYADKWGVPLETLVAELRKPGPGKFCVTMDMFAAMAAQNFIGSSIPAPRPEQWASVLKDTDMPEITKAVYAVLRKRAGLPDGPAETAPTEAAKPAVQ